jgi:hypothetical protein
MIDFDEEVEEALEARNAAMKWCEELDASRRRGDIRVPAPDGRLWDDAKFWTVRHQAHNVFVAARDAHHRALEKAIIKSL